jgi:Uma2 family endonuclease
VPKEYLQRLSITGRVRLELREGEIAIHPAESAAKAHDAETLATELAMAPRRRGGGHWLERLRLRQRGQNEDRPS